MAAYVAAFMKKHIPGMENSYIASTADDLGVRFSRGITNGRRFTREMQFSTAPLEDAIGKCLIIHAERRHPGQTFGCQSPGMACFEVPMGALVPDGMDNLIMGTGRSISAQGYGLIRVMVNTMVVGQGAGTAAGIAAMRGEDIRNVDYAAVRAQLERVGAFRENF